MKSKKPGKTTSVVEILNISPYGIWILVSDVEYFLSFVDFPFFKDATVKQICDVQQPHVGHLYWDSLDVDLSTEILSQPEKFPLISRRAKTSKKAARAS